MISQEMYQNRQQPSNNNQPYAAGAVLPPNKSEQKPNLKLLLVTLALLILFITGMTGAWYYFREPAKQPARNIKTPPAISPSTTKKHTKVEDTSNIPIVPLVADTTTANWKTYRNTTAGFSIKYAPDWTYEERNIANLPNIVKFYDSKFETASATQRASPTHYIEVRLLSIPFDDFPKGNITVDGKPIIIDMKKVTTGVLTGHTYTYKMEINNCAGCSMPTADFPIQNSQKTLEFRLFDQERSGLAPKSESLIFDQMLTTIQFDK